MATSPLTGSVFALGALISQSSLNRLSVALGDQPGARFSAGAIRYVSALELKSFENPDFEHKVFFAGGFMSSPEI